MNRPSQALRTRPIAEALASHDMLGQLLARCKASEARLLAVKAALPPAMRKHVRAGTLDHEGWNLLTPNGAVAAKLRQSVPLLEQILTEQGWPPVSIRVKVVADLGG
jgi:hypothetical protein